MLSIFDNNVRDAQAEILQRAHRADFCAGYFNLRGWSSIDQHIEPWPGGKGRSCRPLVGMQRLPHKELRRIRRLPLPKTNTTSAPQVLLGVVRGSTAGRSR